MTAHNDYMTPDMPLAEVWNPGIGLVDIAQGGDGKIHLRYDDLTSHMDAWKAPHPFIEVVARDPFEYMAEPTKGEYRADKTIIAAGLGPYSIGKGFSQLEERRQSARNAMNSEDGQTLMDMVEDQISNMPFISHIGMIDEPGTLAQARKLRDGTYSLEFSRNLYAEVRERVIAKYGNSVTEQDDIDSIVFEEVLHILGDNLPFRYAWEGIDEEKRVREIKKELYAKKAKSGNGSHKHKRLAEEMQYEIDNIVNMYSGVYSACRKHMNKEDATEYLAKMVEEAKEEGEDVNVYLAKKVKELDENDPEGNETEPEDQDDDNDAEEKNEEVENDTDDTSD
jgi:hypothetical protein